MMSMVSRMAWRCLAYGCIGLGTAGLVVPLLPTTPFLLVAAWAAPKGSPRLARWLWEHPRLGPTLHAWQSQRAVPRRAKRLAAGLLVLSWLVLWLGGAPTGAGADRGNLLLRGHLRADATGCRTLPRPL